MRLQFTKFSAFLVRNVSVKTFVLYVLTPLWMCGVSAIQSKTILRHCCHRPGEPVLVLSSQKTYHNIFFECFWHLLDYIRHGFQSQYLANL